MKALRVLIPAIFSILAVGLAAPGVAWALSDSEEPGSVLVFPKFITGTFIDVGVTTELKYAKTEFEISVVCPTGLEGTPFCSFHHPVRLRAHWVCPPQDMMAYETTCPETSFELETTVNGTLYFNPEGVSIDIAGLVHPVAFPSNATTTIPPPPCSTGYLIVWVIDGGVPIKFDGLIGDAIIRQNDNTHHNSARGYNAIPIQAAPGITTGSPTDVAPTNGRLDFNGSEYETVTGKIWGTVQYEASPLTGIAGNIVTDLTLLTLDVLSGETNPVTSVGLNFYRSNEEFIDSTTSFVCWREQSLTSINTILNQSDFGRKGLVESYKAEQIIDSTGVPVTLLGLVETKEEDSTFFIVRDYAYSLYNNSLPVTTTFAP